ENTGDIRFFPLNVLDFFGVKKIISHMVMVTYTMCNCVTAVMKDMDAGYCQRYLYHDRHGVISGFRVEDVWITFIRKGY
ncbi:MAG TPA: hypothetical protein PK544_14010, partial [Spirochaetota bacterium]|nr:hypothetical protein [Spirochaetota bacterium]